jgi:hypothetical protein
MKLAFALTISMGTILKIMVVDAENNAHVSGLAILHALLATLAEHITFILCIVTILSIPTIIYSLYLLNIGRYCVCGACLKVLADSCYLLIAIRSNSGCSVLFTSRYISLSQHQSS